MTGPADRDRADRDRADRDGAGLHRLLGDLADDPGAPPSSVSGLSVIAAAKAGSGASGGAPVAGSVAGTAGATHLQSLRADTERRAGRRRTMLFGGLAAACAVAVAAIVIPIAVSTSSSTTSAGAAADQTVARQGAGTAAPDGSDSGGADQEGGAAAPPSVDPSNPDANRPAPGENALSRALPAPGGGVAPDGAGANEAAAGCWPPLSDQASAALVAALPAGAFGPPGPLGLGCPADPVGGAQMIGTSPDTQLVVRVTRAEPGACAAAAGATAAGATGASESAASEAAARCVARGGDQYVANDAGNVSVFAYGNGFEVEVGGRPATGIAPVPSGLSAEQLSAAAAAVLAALG